MDKENLVEIIEVWRPVEKGGEAFDFGKQQNLKLVALIANGQPLKLEEDFMINKKYITKQEYKNFKIIC